MTREEAIKHLQTYSTTMGSGQTTDEQHKEAKQMAIEALSAQPEVIQCKDCKHCQAIKKVIWCMKLIRHTEPDFFCGYGEEGNE